jgi:ribulose-phosphate 3-epimerase
VKLAPSILAADFAPLGEQVAEAERAGADRIHVDVVDGHFVPNLSMGAPIVASLRPVTQLPLETHFMITNLDFFLQEFVEAGSDSFLVHWEGNVNLHRTVQSIKAMRKRARASRSTRRLPRMFSKRFCRLDQVLVMTVNLGFAHQQFLHSTLGKLRRLRQMIDRVKPECDLEVDGGIDPETARLCLTRAPMSWWRVRRCLEAGRA